MNKSTPRQKAFYAILRQKTARYVRIKARTSPYFVYIMTIIIYIFSVFIAKSERSSKIEPPEKRERL